jgi:nicotinamide-nucleotide amidase
VLTIGDELLSGAQIDMNGSYLAERLRSRGIEVVRLTSVGDDEEAIARALHESVDGAHVVVVTGGLGPTSDDVTAAAVARAFGRSLILNEQALKHIQNLLDSYGVEKTEGQEKQAYLPEGAEMIPNPGGTAPGFLLREEGRAVIVLPGVPQELRAMVEQTVLPLIEREWEGRPCYRSRILKLFGISEARVDELLRDLVEREDAKIAFLPHLPEIRVGVMVQASNQELGEQKLARWVQKLRERLAPYVFGVDDETMEGVVGALLRDAHATIAIAESCTGGLIGHRLTNVAGSSDYVERVVVTYSNEAKTDLLNVPLRIIQEHGAVSEPTARLMAEGVRALAGTTLGLATTGIAGPAGGTHNKPVGTVFIAIASENDTWVKGYHFPGDRIQIKMITSQVALNRVRKHLLGAGC